MKTYFDQNRLSPQSDRRFHAADLEPLNGCLQVVPAVVERLAPQVVVGAWSWSERMLAGLEREMAPDRVSPGEIVGWRKQRWWCHQWQKPNGLYQVRELSLEEKEISKNLLGPRGIPPECFPRADGALEDDNDANIIAQVITVGGTLLLTSNMVMVDDEALEKWFAENHNRWPVPSTSHRLVERVDDLYNRWWDTRTGKVVLTESVVGAFWPEEVSASVELVRLSALDGLKKLARGHFQTFAPKVIEHIESDAEIEKRIEYVRGNLPVRMRRAERERLMLIEQAELGPPGNIPPLQQAETDQRYDW